MQYLILLFTLATYAFTPSVRDIRDKTYTRDNTFCQLMGRVEVQLRSETRISEPQEKAYGDYLFWYPDEGVYDLLPLNKSKIHSYRFMPGTGSLCSKSLAFKIGPSKVALLLLAENSPFRDKLTIQMIDLKTKSAGEVIETEYMSDLAETYKDGFAFNVHQERHEEKMGKVTKDEIQLHYQNMEFIIWVGYNDKGFEILPSLTYEKFPWKHIYNNQEDFLNATGWDPKKKEFLTPAMYLATNHEQKKECILFSTQKIDLTGSEKDWRCYNGK